MIVAGIDEAGYGPLLGPLVVGCSAFELDVPADSPDIPCLWQRLRRIVSKHRDKKGLKLHINDSKLVYSPSAGLKELERSVLALAAIHRSCPKDLQSFLAHVAAPAIPQLAEHPWYDPRFDVRFPAELDAASLRMMVNALKVETDRTATRCVHFAAHVLPERHYNLFCDRTRNKSSVLFSLATQHLDYLLRTFGQKNLVIVCDRQGGREHYGQLLRMMFEDWSLTVVSEADGFASYELRQNNAIVRLIFREKAEAQCLPVAAASMLCKYLREMLMRRFNAYWRTFLPDLQPTAGYYSDGMRFLQDIAAKRVELGIPDTDLIRSR